MPQIGSRQLLAAKLVVPPARPGAVPRPRLHDRMSAATDARLTTVIAPAGWGKTTLLTAWARDPAESRPVGWLSLDDDDDEPVRFWTYALSALAAVAPHLAREPLAALSGQGFDPVDLAVTELLNALADCEDRYVLVLDDYHLISDPRIHETVEFLLTYLPRALHLVVAARVDPPLPLARWRARGELTEIRASDLACTPDEAAAVIGIEPSIERAATQLAVQRTEGWPAGLHLTGLALRDAADPVAAAAGIRGDHRHVLDYVTAEVLSGLDEPARDLLVRCSVLDRLSGPLCDAVLETTGSAAVLDRLDRTDMFITALDARRSWYRCHQLVREVLRRTLELAAPGTPAALLERAARWFCDQGQLEEAVGHRIAAGDRDGAVEMLDGAWFFERGAMASLLRYGERLAEQSAAHPQLAVWLALAAGLSGDDTATARRWLETAEPGIAAGASAPAGWQSLRAFADVIWSAFVMPADSEASLRFARRAVQLEDDPSQWGWVFARLALAVAQRGVGDLEAAVGVLDEAWQARSRRYLPTYLTLQTAGELMLDLVALGDHRRACQVGAEVAAAAADVEHAWGAGAAPALARLRLAEARITLAEAGADAALPDLQRAVELADTWAGPNIVVLALTSLAAALWASGDRPGARTMLARARDSAELDPPRPYALRELTELEASVGRRAVHRARVSGALVEELTDRELAVLRALQGPLTAREIGAELYLSINTIKGYTKSLYRKLGVVTRADAVARAREIGLI